MKSRIYLDYASLAPVDREVNKLVYSLNKKYVANPNALHTEGVAVREVLEIARKKIATSFGVLSKEIVFTSGGTESDNLAITGVVDAYVGVGIPHVITTVIEHPAVLETIKYLEKKKRITATYLPVDTAGIISIDDFKKALKKETILVSVMYVNNEIGTILPIEEVAKTIRHFKKHNGRDSHKAGVYPLLHTDAAQAIGLMDMHIPKLGVDLLSFNGTKIYGPTGTGCLFVKNGTPIESLFKGGDQEHGLRAGTENVALYIGLAQAVLISEEMKHKEKKRLIELKEYFVTHIKKALPYISFNGSLITASPHIVNISVPLLDSEIAILYLNAKGFAVSAKSACKAKDENPSHVLVAIGNTASEGGIRVSFGRETKKRDIDVFIKALAQVVDKFAKIH